MTKSRTAINPTRTEDFPKWYQEVIKSADMAENSPTRGCMIIKPHGYAIWEKIQQIFDRRIKDLGVQNAYFPLLIPMSFISTEAEHIDGFAKECAVVTHHRLEFNEDNVLVPAGALEEPYVIRPTSESIIGDSMSRWIQSYRDLPMKLNQWCNVMRWEMRPRIFLRTSEFLWQEGHNAFATADESHADAMLMLEEYATFVEKSLSIPVIRGEKTSSERFPGAISTYTVEAIMQDGKALQAGTSHNLGQNFSTSFGIKFQDNAGTEKFAHTTSWGISTRLIGAMIMVHADDDGLRLPPAIAPHQIVIIPVLKKPNQKDPEIIDYANSIKQALTDIGLRVDVNFREENAGSKVWDSIKKGVPIRVEVGQREVQGGTLTYVRRDLGRESKTSCSIEEFVREVTSILESIQATLLSDARKLMEGKITKAADLVELEKMYENNYQGLVEIDSSLIGTESYDDLLGRFSLSERCLPFSDKGKRVVIGRAY